MSITKALFIFLICFTHVSCGILYKNKIPKSIKIEVDTTQAINYGTPISFDVIGTYAKGKTKNIQNFSDVTVSSENGEIIRSKLTPITYPSNFNDSTISMSATFKSESKTLTDQITLLYNYNSNLKLDFSGENGSNGSNGRKGALNFLTRSGTDGTSGEDGANGMDGSELLVHIWMENDKYHICVNNLTKTENYYYAIKPTDHKLEINVSGGNGGDGGNGGAGGNGKDEDIKNDKTKEAGDGGDGGNGGNGGMGGSPGNVYIYLHPTAADYKNNIKVRQTIGRSGKMGLGNSGGKGGESSNRQTINGTAGFDGIDGFENESGSSLTIEVQEFDINQYHPF